MPEPGYDGEQLVVQVEESQTAVAKVIPRWYALFGSRCLLRTSLSVSFIGQDLSGNTFWEFKDALNANRFRRIVKYNNRIHYGDVKITRTLNPHFIFSKLALITYYVSAQWHQWLRYVRHDPPSIEEQQRDVVRQIQMKKLAQLADERWASKPSYLDKPQTQQPAPVTRTSDPTIHPTESSGSAPDARPGVENAVESQAEGGKKEQAEKKPWAKVPSGPSETWQPESWTPSAARR